MTKESVFQDPAFLKVVTVIGSHIPSFAGSVVSLAFVRELNTWGRIGAVFVGVTTAVYLAPALIEILSHFVWHGMPPKVGDGVKFLVGLCAMGALPKLIKYVERVSGNPTGLLAKLAAPEPAPPPPPAEEGAA